MNCPSAENRKRRTARVFVPCCALKTTCCVAISHTQMRGFLPRCPVAHSLRSGSTCSASMSSLCPSFTSPTRPAPKNYCVFFDSCCTTPTAALIKTIVSATALKYTFCLESSHLQPFTYSSFRLIAGGELSIAGALVGATRAPSQGLVAMNCSGLSSAADQKRASSFSAFFSVFWYYQPSLANCTSRCRSKSSSGTS